MYCAYFTKKADNQNEDGHLKTGMGSVKNMSELSTKQHHNQEQVLKYDQWRKREMERIEEENLKIKNRLDQIKSIVPKPESHDFEKDKTTLTTSTSCSAVLRTVKLPPVIKKRHKGFVKEKDDEYLKREAEEMEFLYKGLLEKRPELLKPKTYKLKPRKKEPIEEDNYSFDRPGRNEEGAGYVKNITEENEYSNNPSFKEPHEPKPNQSGVIVPQQTLEPRTVQFKKGDTVKTVEVHGKLDDDNHVDTKNNKPNNQIQNAQHENPIVPKLPLDAIKQPDKKGETNDYPYKEIPDKKTHGKDKQADINKHQKTDVAQQIKNEEKGDENDFFGDLPKKNSQPAEGKKTDLKEPLPKTDPSKDVKHSEGNSITDAKAGGNLNSAKQVHPPVSKEYPLRPSNQLDKPKEGLNDDFFDDVPIAGKQKEPTSKSNKDQVQPTKPAQKLEPGKPKTDVPEDDFFGDISVAKPKVDDKSNAEVKKPPVVAAKKEEEKKLDDLGDFFDSPPKEKPSKPVAEEKPQPKPAAQVKPTQPTPTQVAEKAKEADPFGEDDNMFNDLPPQKSSQPGPKKPETKPAQPVDQPKPSANPKEPEDDFFGDLAEPKKKVPEKKPAPAQPKPKTEEAKEPVDDFFGDIEKDKPVQEKKKPQPAQPTEEPKKAASTFKTFKVE